MLAVFACGKDVGADVQKIIPRIDYIAIADKFFAPEERIDVEAKDGCRIFFRYWSAKKAYLKATGVGLTRGMDYFSVRGNTITENGSKKQEWQLIPIEIEGYAAYAAVRTKVSEP